MLSSNGQGPRYHLDLMRQEDVAEVAQVERRCFTNPWPVSAYRRELQHPEQNYYIILRDCRPPAPTEPVDAAHAAATRPLPRRTLLPIAFGRRPEPGERPAQSIVGFAGMWNAFDEAHVTTIAVDEPYRGQGLGEVLLTALFDEATRRGANWLTLEVRVSNAPAQALYRKWGFSVQGVRRRYYSDNNEDAHIMWSRAL
ncbi:MAG: ribosomal protein S18-alanine N-acetyltransferase, partial [Thermomicrobiales bacterium]|nr:ribosomal protein S18-alanine N-acetyltransferase [Thermomicrobiales bacterium]